MKTLPSKIEKAKKKPTRSEEKKKGEYMGFNKLVSELKKKSKDENEFEKSMVTALTKAVNNPEALAAWIGRKKYGKEAYQKMAAKGKKKK